MEAEGMAAAAVDPVAAFLHNCVVAGLCSTVAVPPAALPAFTSLAAARGIAVVPQGAGLVAVLPPLPPAADLVALCARHCGDPSPRTVEGLVAAAASIGTGPAAVVQLAECCLAATHGRLDPSGTAECPLLLAPGLRAVVQQAVAMALEVRRQPRAPSRSPELGRAADAGQAQQAAALHRAAAGFVSSGDEDDVPAPGEEVVDDAPAVAEYLEEAAFRVTAQPGTYHTQETRSGRPCIGAVFVRDAIPEHLRLQAARALRPAATRQNRRARTNGGTPPLTGIVGHYDYLTNPSPHKCRLTKFARDNWGTIEGNVAPFLQCLANVYKTHAGEHYEWQLGAVPRHHQLFDTPFSTLTVNDTFRTAAHTDRGDFQDGLGLLTILDGTYRGCHLAIPRLGLAFDLRPGDVLAFDTRLVHGNTEPRSADWSRVGVVAYLRTGLSSQRCEMEHRARLEAAVPRPLGPQDTVVDFNYGAAGAPPLPLPRAIYTMLSQVQRSAVSFAHRSAQQRGGCVIAMDMGLGKTLVGLCVAFAAQLDLVVVVAPKSVLSHWEDEARRWAEHGLRFRRFVVASEGVLPADLHPGLLPPPTQRGGGAVVVVNAESVCKVVERGLRPGLVIVDEGRVSAPEGRILDTLGSLEARRRVVLNGTPLHNALSDLYHLVQWANSREAGMSHDAFQRCGRAIDAYADGNDAEDALEAAVAGARQITGWLQASLFRARDDSLPPRRDVVVMLRPSQLQRATDAHLGGLLEAAVSASEHRAMLLSAHPLCYAHSAARAGAKARAEAGAEVPGWAAAYQAALGMGLAVDGPLPSPAAARDLLCDSPKLRAVVEIAAHAKRSGQQVLVFSQYIAVQEVIAATLRALDIDTVALHGSLTHAQRRHVLGLFSGDTLRPAGHSDACVAQAGKERDADAAVSFGQLCAGRAAYTGPFGCESMPARPSPPTALVLSTKAGAYGLDLTGASTVVLVDSWWNPQIDLQAVARAHRRRQKRTVTVYRLCLSGSGEVRTLAAQQRKLALFRFAVDETPTHAAPIHDAPGLPAAALRRAHPALAPLLHPVPTVSLAARSVGAVPDDGEAAACVVDQVLNYGDFLRPVDGP